MNAAKTIKTDVKSNEELICFDDEFYMGKIEIDAHKDDYEKIKIVAEDDSDLDVNLPDYGTKLKLTFYVNYEIKNEDSDNKEKWVFKIILKDGLGPYSTVIDSKTKEINDKFAVNDEQNGKIEVSTEIDRASYIDKEQRERNFRVELIGEYYKGSWLGGSLSKKAEKDGWSNLETKLINQRPGAPTITGPSEGSINEAHTFTATATDSDGDQIRYVFIWGNGRSSQTDFMNSGETGTVSYTWTQSGSYEVQVFAEDRFWDSGEATTLRFSAPRSQPLEKSIFDFLLQRYPQLERVLNFLKL